MAWAEFLLGLVHSYGYLGVFFASTIANATVLLPLPAFVFIIAAATVLNPLFVALAGASGAAIGELTGYGVGYGGSALARNRLRSKHRYVRKMEQWFRKRPGFLTIMLFAALPLPFDVIGILTGILRYDVRKFMLAVFIGRFFLYALIAYASSFGIQAILAFFR